MKDHERRIRLAVTLAVFVFASPWSFAEVYKVVDAEGNVTYTDQPPNSTAKPEVLRELSVISPQITAPVGVPIESGVAPEAKDVSIGDLRRIHKGFAIVSPKPEEALWGTENKATVAWSSSAPLNAGMGVAVFVDGVAQEPTNAPVTLLTGLDRGEHKVYAELWDDSGRKIATTPTVTFYIMQNSIQFPQRRTGNG